MSYLERARLQVLGEDCVDMPDPQASTDSSTEDETPETPSMKTAPPSNPTTLPIVQHVDPKVAPGLAPTAQKMLAPVMRKMASIQMQDETSKIAVDKEYLR